MTIQFAPGRSWNDTHWDHERFNKILIEARAELDEAKRREMYVELQCILRDEGGEVVPVFANTVLACNDKVTHGELTAISPFDGRRVAERWWFEP